MLTVQISAIFATELAHVVFLGRLLLILSIFKTFFIVLLKSNKLLTVQ